SGSPPLPVHPPETMLVTWKSGLTLAHAAGGLPPVQFRPGRGSSLSLMPSPSKSPARALLSQVALSVLRPVHSIVPAQAPPKEPVLVRQLQPLNTPTTRPMTSRSGPPESPGDGPLLMSSHGRLARVITPGKAAYV